MCDESSSSQQANSLLAEENKDRACRLGATLAELIDIMDIAMWELDRDYRVVGFNRKAREIYGEDALGQFCYQAAAKCSTICENCPAEVVFGGQDSGRSEHKRIRANGETIYIDHIATPIRDTDGRVTGALILIIDITRQKELELELIARRDDFEQRLIERTRALEESREQYRQLYEESKKGEALYLSVLNATTDALVITSLDGEIRFINPSFTRTFGYELAELEGKPLASVAGMNSSLAGRQFQLLRDEGQPIAHHITKWPTKNGRLLDISLSAARYADHRNQPIGIVCSIRDFTEAKALELQLFRAQKFEALGTMAGGLAHDFNNLLMGIQGNASLMQFEYHKGRANYSLEKLNNIEKYVQQGEQLTRQLLTLVRNDAHAVKTLDLNRLIANSGKLFGQTRKEILMEYRLNDGLWPVQADSGQIEQVLLNLFVNAAHAMPSGGELRLTSENVHLSERETRPFHRPAGRYVRVSVTDSGCGIDPAILERIFDPFFTTKGEDGGTGLGLASAYSIINNHGGMIRAANVEGGGARFTLLFPASERSIDQEKGPEMQFVRGSGTILVVDDEETVLELTREMLEHLGYNVLTASSGEEATRIFSEKGQGINLVLLDMIMPRMSGIDVFNRLRLLKDSTKILFFSGYTLSEPVTDLINQQDCDFIRKPFSIQDISKKIGSMLSR